jgi:hypothetical protein
MKHQAGNKVRIIANNSLHGFKIGEEITIHDVHDDTYLSTDNQGDQWFFIDSEIESIPDPIESFRNRVIEELGKMTLEKNGIIQHEDAYDYGTLSDAIERIINLK